MEAWMNEEAEKLRMQLMESEAKNAGLVSEIDRLGDRIKRKNSALEEACILSETFPSWVETYFSSGAQLQSVMLAQKRTDLLKLAVVFNGARRV
jgi:hypothetical protein